MKIAWFATCAAAAVAALTVALEAGAVAGAAALKPAAHSQPRMAVAAAPPVAATPAQPAIAAPARLALRLEGCDGVPASEVRDLVAADLRGTEVVAAPSVAAPGAGDDAAAIPTGDDAATAVVACAAGAATITIVRPADEPSPTRSLTLASTAPIARPFAIAVAVTELVLAGTRWRPPPAAAERSEARSTAQLAGIPPPAAAFSSSPLAARTAPVATESAPVHDARLGVRASALTFAGAPVLWGGGVRFQRRQALRWGWQTDLSLRHGLRPTSLGDVSVDLLSAGAALFGEIATRSVAWQAAAGFEAGAARLRGTPSGSTQAQGGQVQGLWGGPLLRAGALWAPRRGRLFVHVEAEAGWTTFPLGARVQDHDPVQLQRGWAGLALGVGFAM